MCGIFAYTGKKESEPILIEGLKTLEYRGYDSAGLVGDSGVYLRSLGEVDNLKKKFSTLKNKKKSASGIAHTRWATHGEPSEVNAHPHTDCSGDIYIVHNGIIENYEELKKQLEKKGHTFRSKTDSEVVAHLIEEKLDGKKDLAEAVGAALLELRGAYGLAVMSLKNKGVIVVARLGSPIVIGIGDGEYFAASDPSALLRHTSRALYLSDGDIAVLSPEKHSVHNLSGDKVERQEEKIEGKAEEIKKGGYAHFMEKEIMEAPEVLKNTIRGKLLLKESDVRLGGLTDVKDRLRDIERIIIVGCGSAYYAGLAGEYLIEEHAKIPVEVEVASEFRYRSPVIGKNTAVLAISQSGETADTLAAVREGKRRGALTLGIVNVVGSTIAREVDAGIYNHAGPEISVASTKVFLSQLTVLALFSLYLGRQRGLSSNEAKNIIEEINSLPDKLKSILAKRQKIKAIARNYKGSRDFLYLGRRYNMPIALEGALKLKEISYIHSEGVAGGEIKHGPLAMIDKDFITVAIAPSDSVYEKMLGNMEEVKARKGRVIAVGTEGDKRLPNLADDVIFIPPTIESLSPILSVVPLQLFAYYMALEKGLPVDRPRNLAKSVTVE